MSSAAMHPEKANPRPLPQPLFTAALIMVGIGVAAFVWGLFSDPQSTWLAYHANFMYVTMLSLGGLTLSAIYSIVGAKWPGPYRRFAEGLAAFVPVSLILAIIGIAGADYIFPWTDGRAMHGKEVWLNEARVYGTDLGLLLVMSILCFFFLKASNRPNLRNLAENGQGFAKRMAESWTAGWQGDEEERAIAQRKTATLAPLIALMFGIGFSLFNFDQVMSMDQAWFSNLFGAYVDWGGILSAVACCALLGIIHRGAPGFQGEITEARMHDIGKMMFAFSIFWMYLFWSQYLVIYYGNLPEETGFLRDRLGNQFMIDKEYSAAAFDASWRGFDFQLARLQTGYGWVAMTVWACNWIIPFWVLLGAYPKKNPVIAGSVASILLFGFWVERNLLVWPSVVKDDMLSFIGPIQIGIALGFIGAFMTVFLIYSRVFPSIAVSDKS